MPRPFVRPASRTIAVLAAAVTLVLGTATQGQAEDSGRPWISASCATGQFTRIVTDAEGHVGLHGNVTKCASSSPDAAFTLVAFHPETTSAYAYSYALMPYNPTGPTRFSGTFRVVPSARRAGVCAMRSLSARIACVRVTWPADGPATMEPIPTTDPLVHRPVTYVTKEEASAGFCGSCLDHPGS